MSWGVRINRFSGKLPQIRKKFGLFRIWGNFSGFGGLILSSRIKLSSGIRGSGKTGDYCIALKDKMLLLLNTFFSFEENLDLRLLNKKT